MTTVTDLLTDIDARYRNTFTVGQKLSWMNIVYRQIYQMVRHESVPYTFQTVSGNPFYPIPGDCDIKGIENVTIETDPGSNTFKQLEYVRKEDEEIQEFYTFVEQSLFLYPVPTDTTQGKNVYIYYNKKPDDLTTTSVPDLDPNYVELLILGTLSRIAAARKDAVMKNNYDQDFQMLVDDYQFLDKMTDPEFLTPIDELPRIRRSW